MTTKKIVHQKDNTKKDSKINQTIQDTPINLDKKDQIIIKINNMETNSIKTMVAVKNTDKSIDTKCI